MQYGRPPASVSSDAEGPDNLDLIRQSPRATGRITLRCSCFANVHRLRHSGTEVAIMKKVDHPNIASVHEVIDVTRCVPLLIYSWVSD